VETHNLSRTRWPRIVAVRYVERESLLHTAFSDHLLFSGNYGVACGISVLLLYYFVGKSFQVINDRGESLSYVCCGASRVMPDARNESRKRHDLTDLDLRT